MDIDHATALAEELQHHVLKGRKPVQNVVLQAVDGIQRHVSSRVCLPPPLRGKDIMCAVDDMRHSVFVDKGRSQVGSRAHKNAWAKPRGGLAEIVGREHASLMFTPGNAKASHTAPSDRHTPLLAAGTDGVRRGPACRRGGLVGFPSTGLGDGFHGAQCRRP